MAEEENSQSKRRAAGRAEEPTGAEEPTEAEEPAAEEPAAEDDPGRARRRPRPSLKRPPLRAEETAGRARAGSG